MNILFLVNYTEKLSTKHESIQYNADQLWQKLGFKSLKERCSYRKICTFSKIFKNESHNYLFNQTQVGNQLHNTRNSGKIPHPNIVFSKVASFCHQ